jgi:dephospho-CoA kinase
VAGKEGYKVAHMLIGITGTDGAGKGTVVEYLVKQRGYLHFSSRGLITRELLQKGLPTDRPHLRQMANELRAHYGDDYVIKAALAEVRESALDHLIIESIRTTAEVAALRRAGGILLAVDADVEVRFARIQGRGSASDQVTFDEFVAQEQLEMNDPDPHGMQKAMVMAMADYTIINNASVKELEEAIEVALMVPGEKTGK